MSPLQFLSWLAQTATFTGVSLSIMFLLLTFENGWNVLALVATIPITVGLGFVWLVTHLLSSLIVKNTMSKLGWALALIWLIMNTIIVYLFMNKLDPDELVFAFVGFNVIYPFIAVILTRNFSNQNLAISNKKPFLLSLKFQIVLSILIAGLLMTLFYTRILSF